MHAEQGTRVRIMNTVAAVVAAFSGQYVFALSAPSLVAERLYVPQGLTDVSEALVVVEGQVEGCGTLGDPVREVDWAARRISVSWPSAAEGPDGCSPSAFSSTVALGVLPAGDYHISIANLNERLVISEAQGAEFEEVYAELHGVMVLESRGEIHAVLTGVLSHPCMVVDETIVKQSGSVVEIFPRMRELDSPGGCQNFGLPFRRVVRIGDEGQFGPGRYMLLVHGAGGRLVTTMFTVGD